MVYKDLADRCIINPTQTDRIESKVFYIRPDTIFTSEPRIQNQYRNEFIRQVSAPPCPEPFTLMADDFQKCMIDNIRDQSSPLEVRQNMHLFFKRRQFHLQHKKHKFLQRWSHFALTSEIVDKLSINFQPCYAKVQFELEKAVQRHSRLEGDDHFNNQPRPQRIEQNGLIHEDDVHVEKLQKHCTLKQDDIDVYNRVVCYQESCNKPAEKFINRAKWVPLQHRYDIYVQGQERVQNLRKNALERQKIWQKRIEIKGNYLINLKKLGERGFKELQQINSTLIIEKQAKKIKSVRDTYLQTASYSYEIPPMIIWNQIDLKLTLEDLCKDFKISGDMEIDDGNSFSYSVVVQFPTFFFNQVIKTQFAPYDAVPQILNPAELCRKDLQDIIESNYKKYGKSAPGSTLLEQIDIQKESEKMKIQYINQIEKALFGEFNNGQLLDEFPSVRMKKAHWLPYICFKAEISKEQMQQAALLNGEQNVIDQVIVQTIQIFNINDISNVNLTLESLSQIHHEKLRSGQIRQEFVNINHSDTDSIFTEGQQMFFTQFQKSIKTKAAMGYTGKQMQDEAELPKNSMYDTQQHLLFAQYLMVCLKSREHKTKLLYILNAFRSIQKRISLELRELATRDRVCFDINIVEPKEKTDTGYRNNESEAFEENQELHTESVVMDELIDINKFKFQGQLQNSMWSTCPILPKYHITYGEPIERQEVSKEFEVNKNIGPTVQAVRHLGRVDFIKEHQSGTLLVSDDFGVKIMYDCTFADMRALEQELIKIMSFYINKMEPLMETDLRIVFPTVDRFNLVKEMIMCEEEFQQAKLYLAFQYIECYEHVCDTLEQQRIIQIIVDLMAKRPRLNLAANHFADSYKIEVQVLQTQTKLMKEFIRMMIDNEQQSNNQIREALEKTFRLVQDQLENKWQYFEAVEINDEKEKRRLANQGVQSDADVSKAKKLEKARPGMFQAKHQIVSPQQFADMLGLPVSNLQILLKEHHERDPLVKQSLLENVAFQRIQEGYPIFFQTTELSKTNQVQLVPQANPIGIIDIFESLSQIVKVVAASHHAVREILDCHLPDNGLVASMYELVTLEFMLAELRAVKSEQLGSQVVSARDLDIINDQSMLGNPDMMMFHIKELAATHEDSTINLNPVIFTKLDITSINEYDFDAAQQNENFQSKKCPVNKFQKLFGKNQIVQKYKNQKNKAELKDQAKQQKAEEGSDLDTVQALEKMLNEPEDSVSDIDNEKDELNKNKINFGGNDRRYIKFKRSSFKPLIPSMLELCCNAVEAMRLRSLLVQAYHQRSTLIPVYMGQCQRLGKEPKVFFKDTFNFETHLNGGTNWENYVDTGPGTDAFVKTELSIREFDPTMISCCHFSEPDAFKAIILPLGLEELRVVVRYELLSLQILVIGVRHNQILIDNCMRQLSEIELFEKGFLVSAPACDILSKLQGQNLFESNLKRLPDNERRKIQQKLLEKVSKCAYSVISKKNRPKEFVESAFKKIRQSIIDKRFEKAELGLRYLRSSRMMLAHDFCTDIETAIYLDAIRLELLNETNTIRKRAYLMPRETMLHKIPASRYGEHTYAAYAEEYHEDQPYEWEFYNAEKRQISDFWKLPDFYECCTLDLQLEDFQQKNQRILYKYNLDEIQAQVNNPNNFPALLDPNQRMLLKSFVPVLTNLSQEQIDFSISEKGRIVDFKEAPSVKHHILFKYLFYFRQLSNLFDLEYFKCKLATQAVSICTLEASVMSGMPFWEANQEIVPVEQDQSEEEDFGHKKAVKVLTPYSLQQDNAEFRNKLAEQVILKMTENKKYKLQLTTELDSLKELFNKFANKMRKQQLNTDLFQSGQYLQELVNLSFNNTLLSLYLVRDIQIKGQAAQKEIQSINDLLNIFSHMDDSKVTYTNGYHVNIATTSIGRVSLDDTPHRIDYRNFLLASQPVIDEQGLNPPEFNLIHGLYTCNSTQIKQYRRLRPYNGWLPPRDFHYLDFKLLNMTRDLRKQISANIIQSEQSSLQYAHAKFKIDAPIYQSNLNTQLEVYNEQKQFIRMQIKSKKLQTILMILMSKQLLSSDVSKLNAFYTEFRELFNWKVVSASDLILKHKTNRSENIRVIQEQIVSKKQEESQQVLNLFDGYSCEVDVYQREIQNFMILTAKRMIERETTSLARAFELNGKRLEVLIDVHQQFAATFDTTQDKRNHLDIVNKVAPVQKMITQIKNRMLVVNTLTGGEGIIIRTKDLNSILEDLCRSIIKNGEIEMRTRCEQLSLQIIQYENLLYSKDQQLFNMENKLKHAKDELNKIINTKVFSKGNALIYEFDHNQRQLRLLKDNVYELEKQLKEQVRLAFDKDLEQARLQLAESRKKFTEYQKTLNSHVKADIQRNINELDVQLKRLVQRKDDVIDPNVVKPANQLLDEYAHLLQGDAKREYKEAQLSGMPSDKSRIFSNKELENIFREMERVKASEKDARDELLEMENLLRKQRMIQNFKWLISQKKHDLKVDNLKQQLTSNTTLWEQLAESEKRERVLKQELQRTQEEVASQDKALEKIKDELKSEQLEKHKLLNFKETKLKRLNQLEDMAKQMELLQSIDLEKVLSSMGQKEKQLQQLKSETKDGAEVIAQIYRSKNKEVNQTREFAKQESKMKEAALSKMEMLRAEIQLLQSGDLSSMNLWKDKVQKLREQKTDILNQFSNPSLYNQTSGSISLTQKNSVDDQMVKHLPQLTVRSNLKQKKKQNNVFEQLVTESQMISGFKEPRSTRKLAQKKLIEDSLMQSNLLTIHNHSHNQSHNTSHEAQNIFHTLQTKLNSPTIESIKYEQNLRKIEIGTDPVSQMTLNSGLNSGMDRIKNIF